MAIFSHLTLCSPNLIDEWVEKSLKHFDLDNTIVKPILMFF